MKYDALIKQLEDVLAEYDSLRARSQHDDISDMPVSATQSFISRVVATIHRLTGLTSTYAQELKRIFEIAKQPYSQINMVAGVAQALLADLKSGYVQTLAELIHANTFADFLDMAQHLADLGYKDAAAVLGGSTLESHVRALCSKHGIDVERTAADGIRVPRKADSLNGELAKLEVYSKLDQKSITAWCDLRNNAAHGKYDAYGSEQVQVMLAGIREFIGRIPA